jgi:hypothetical protein
MLSLYDILVIGMISCLMNTLFTVVEYKDLYDFLEKTLISVSYNAIYVYSYTQVNYNKLKNITKPYISIVCISVSEFLKQHNLMYSNPSVSKLIFEVYGNGYNIKNITLDSKNDDKLVSYVLDYNNENNNENNNEVEDQQKWYNNYDLIIFSDNLSDSNCINKIHYVDFPTRILYETSNVKFISVNLTYNTNEYTIDLKTDEYNHYIVDNVLNKDFFKYYLTNVLQIKIEDEFDYKVTIIDQDANFIDLYPKDVLVFKENSYEIKLYTEINGKEEEKEEKEEEKEKEEEIYDDYDYIKLETKYM